jgi:hypothetical protein
MNTLQSRCQVVLDRIEHLDKGHFAYARIIYGDLHLGDAFVEAFKFDDLVSSHGSGYSGPTDYRSIDIKVMQIELFGGLAIFDTAYLGLTCRIKVEGQGVDGLGHWDILSTYASLISTGTGD